MSESMRSVSSSSAQQKWTNSAGPQKSKPVIRLIRLLSALKGCQNQTVTYHGVIGDPSSDIPMIVSALFGPPTSPEIVEIWQQLGDQFGWQITNENLSGLESAAADALKRAKQLRPIEDNRVTPEQDAARKAELHAKYADQRAAEQRYADQVRKILAKRPARATALIVAELHEDQSDSMSDYHAHRVTRTVAIGFRTGSRESFPQLRKAAAQFEPTAHLGPSKGDFEVRILLPGDRFGSAPAPYHELHGKRFDERAAAERAIESADLPILQSSHRINSVEAEALPQEWAEIEPHSIEHRENYSMGAGNYLKRGFRDWDGWAVRSMPISEDGQQLSCSGNTFIEDAIPDGKPPKPRGGSGSRAGKNRGSSSGSESISADGVTVSLSDAKNGIELRFEDKPSSSIRDQLKAGRIPGYFPTPPAVARELIELAEIEPGHSILEPSEGSGRLADLIDRDKNPNLSMSGPILYRDRIDEDQIRCSACGDSGWIEHPAKQHCPAMLEPCESCDALARADRAAENAAEAAAEMGKK